MEKMIFIICTHWIVTTCLQYPSSLSMIWLPHSYFYTKCNIRGRPVAKLDMKVFLHPSIYAKHLSAQAASTIFQAFNMTN